ncbi:hypothetical protein [Sphingobacterium sp. SGR-19]|uniref:hypothetical protein n=1 Tax=Sphingobacterium sp. SGR-19 TaxID=2710886 RepID=UPI0013EC8342|nr:hypothetical protein [Sphingobacterium sp. SGR-19]NGM65442.1 hypothetical protein [Sphingobacterium sp. SGR-19]
MTISITSPYGLFTSPYHDTVSLPSASSKSSDESTPAYRKIANSYFITIMYLYM